MALIIFVLKHRHQLMLSHYTYMHKLVNYVVNYSPWPPAIALVWLGWVVWWTALPTRSFHGGCDRHWAPLNPNQPHHQPWTRMIQIFRVNLHLLLNIYTNWNKNEQILLLNLAATCKSFLAGLSAVNVPPETPWPVSSGGENEVLELHQEPPSLHMDRKLGRPTPRHLCDTNLQHAWLDSCLFPWEPKGLKLWNEKVAARKVTTWGRSPPTSSFRKKNTGCLVKNRCHVFMQPSSSSGARATQRPTEQWYYMLALYPVISGCLSSKGPISHSAALGWCKRNQWELALQLPSHTSGPRVAPLGFDNDWRLVPSPCTRYYEEPNGYFFMS